MKRINLLLVFTFACIQAFAQTKPIPTFDFLIGNWQQKKASGTISEHWKKKDNTFVGSSYAYSARGDKKLTETIVIKKTNNDWYLVVTGYEKGNTGTTSFRLVKYSGNNLLFENLKHDFPQRISYQLIDKNKLSAWIEGPGEKGPLKIEFNYERIK